MYTFVVVAIFKNESHAIAEWIEHYLQEGCEHFYLIDNDSTDDWKEKVKPYQEYITYTQSDLRHSQTFLYNTIREKVVRDSKWVAVVDLDEFLFAKDQTIQSYLETLPEDVGQILVHWTMFGSAGHLTQPPSIVQGFTKTWSTPKEIEVKGIVRCSNLVQFRIHAHETLTTTTTSDGRHCSTDPILPSTNLQECKLQLNHYCIQSRDFFQNVKATRGDAESAEYDTFRDMGYFQRYDRNKCSDVLLAEKRKSTL